MTEPARQITSDTTLYGFETRDIDNRRVAPEERKTHDIKQLWQRSHEILGLALQGLKQTEIAKVLNITPQTVSNCLNSELGRQKLSHLRGERDDEYKKINERVMKLVHKSLDTYEQIFVKGDVDMELKKKTADTITLDLAGMRAPTKVESKNLNVHATTEDIEAFKKRGLAAARESGLLVTVEGESPPDS